MTLKYYGTRDNNRIGTVGLRNKRIAEFAYNDDETDRFFNIISSLESLGWNIDTGVANWACVEVADKEEFNNLMEDYKEAKRNIKK